MSFFANLVDDGYGTMIYELTTAGYVALFAVLLILVAAIGLIGKNKRQQHAIKTKQLVFSALAIALATVTSMLKLFDMPMGGSVTLFSMMFICLIGYWYGVKVGLMTGVAYGLLQMLIDPYIMTLPQLLLDYILAFGVLGLSGLFSNKKHGLFLGYLVGVFGRFFCSALSGIIFFASYAPETMHPVVYSVLYNASYMGAEALLTIVLMSIPPVKKALQYVKQMSNN
ncbi:energy-coupled thiamine transporter ThiT [Diplocloster modestus]|uniref:Energy-coupled thiamine transporter ThiT n=1 Tax=Diplocloster modestus TaxID=2850322 RepID=A0ABS6KEP2_9FIRM|nr:energy-coupled thiamine transporter ThiT [Diplocloster modestus]MBU9728988.1 energy-coupled thiamine transporter ThiT [Diplocloster modestus]